VGYEDQKEVRRDTSCPAFPYLCAMFTNHPDFHSFVYSEELLALVKAANETSVFLETFSGEDGKAFVSLAVRHLADVYAAMLRVRDTEPVYETSGDPVVTEQDWSALFQRIARLLGAHNEILRPAGEEEFDRSELVAHSISEDLADVYQELRDFTSIYSRGMEELMNDAAWELKEHFAEHWGAKLLRSLSALHELYVSGIDPTEE
jgi:hypothetical protein